MLPAEFSAASTTACEIVRADLRICCSVFTCCVHMKVGPRPVSILICIPGCFKLNYFVILLFCGICKKHTQMKWRMMGDKREVVGVGHSLREWRSSIDTHSYPPETFSVYDSCHNKETSISFFAPKAKKMLFSPNRLISQIKINWSEPTTTTKASAAAHYQPHNDNYNLLFLSQSLSVSERKRLWLLELEALTETMEK